MYNKRINVMHETGHYIRHPNKSKLQNNMYRKIRLESKNGAYMILVDKHNDIVDCYPHNEYLMNARTLDEIFKEFQATVKFEDQHTDASFLPESHPEKVVETNPAIGRLMELFDLEAKV